MYFSTWERMAVVSVVSLLLIASEPVAANVVTAFATGFETGEGYSVGALSGQDDWQGNIELHIAVDGSSAKSGTQSLKLNGSGSTAQIEDYRAFGAVSGEFTWAFSVRDQGYYNGSDNFVRLSDTGNDAYAVYLFLDGMGYSGLSIKCVDVGGMYELAIVNDGEWHDIVIVGDTSDDTFDFRLDGLLPVTGNPFYQDVDDIANLSVGSDRYSGGAYQIRVDDVSVTYVPTPGTIMLLVPGLVGFVQVRRNRAR